MILFPAEVSENAEEKRISESTKGVVFCSVPHRGSQIAAMNVTGKMLLLPTLEVTELSSGTALSTNYSSPTVHLYMFRSTIQCMFVYYCTDRLT